MLSDYFLVIKKQILEAFSSPELTPDQIAKFILSSKERVITDHELRRILSNEIEQKKIEHLYHFTHIENVKKIFKYGIIPRELLDLSPVRLAVVPYFSDSQRYDDRRDQSCFSISFPNYRMFYSKRKRKNTDWAVLEIDGKILKTHHFEFTPENSANFAAKRFSGVKGLERLFCNIPLREYLRLQINQTTHPEAEAVTDSYIKPLHIKNIYVESQLQEKKLALNGIKSKIDKHFFSPRHDWQYWGRK